MNDRQRLLAIRPETRRARAGWMAISQPGSSLGIGVVGRTEQQAQKRFEETLRKWADLLYPEATDEV